MCVQERHTLFFLGSTPFGHAGELLQHLFVLPDVRFHAFGSYEPFVDRGGSFLGSRTYFRTLYVLLQKLFPQCGVRFLELEDASFQIGGLAIKACVLFLEEGVVLEELRFVL
jgi:hypothetical protein